jgi:disulfide bond formation protein DsbB
MVLLFASVLTLATAYVFQYGFGYHPCDLCYLQRYPYMGVIAIAALGLFLDSQNDDKPRSNFLAIAILLAVISLLFYDAYVAAFHVGVEQKWWQGPTSCSSTIDTTLTGEALLEQIMKAPVVNCGDIQWELFGISMAGYNFLMALSLGLFGTFNLVKCVKAMKNRPEAPKINDPDHHDKN